MNAQEMAHDLQANDDGLPLPTPDIEVPEGVELTSQGVPKGKNGVTAAKGDGIVSATQPKFEGEVTATIQGNNGAVRIIAIGDAWHSASPQLGQGANMALLDAWSLARGLAEDGYDLALAHLAARRDARED